MFFGGLGLQTQRMAKTAIPKGTLMLVIKYFFWIMALHLVTFYKVWPHHFFVGMGAWVYYLVSSLAADPESRVTIVRMGAQGLLEGLDQGVVPKAPGFIRRRLMIFMYEGR